MTEKQKSEVVSLILDEKDRLGSQNKVATKTGASTATISQMINKNWELIDERMWRKVAASLGWKAGNEWQIVETTNTQILHGLCDDAKTESLWVAVSHRAGGGKTASLTTFARRSQSVFYLSCREWARREFLNALAQHLGIADAARPQSVDSLLMQVVGFFRQRADHRPLLILDEADKLRSPALRTLITLYNECPHSLGVVICGTDHLKKQMEADARHQRKGAEELLSRFGRGFITLFGATETDVKNICRANGLTEPKTLTAIWKECQPVQRMLGNDTAAVVEDLRKVERAVRRELLRQETELIPNAVAEAA